MSEANGTITIDGKSYEVSRLSENAKSQIANIKATDREIEHLKAKMAIYQTARMAYSRALKDELDKGQSPN